ncbi:MAG: hypothetical protein J1F43_08400 [Muribaculaceae bacterium]|nr:hypothetical protein [Muribaculaceae bacterium]
MKSYLFKILFGMFATLIFYSGTASAQTYFRPFSMSTNDENVSLSFNDGSTFNGIKRTSLTNGQVSNVCFLGTYRYPSGEKIMTEKGGEGFDTNFNFRNGNFYYFNNNGEMYRWYFNNGQKTETRDYRQYSIDGNFIVIYTDSYGGGYASPSYNGGSNSNSNSNYNSHKATCRGCNGSGKCQHCRGVGYVNNYNTKCSLCYGNGTCVSCHGQGYIRGNF